MNGTINGKTRLVLTGMLVVLVIASAMSSATVTLPEKTTQQKQHHKSQIDYWSNPPIREESHGDDIMVPLVSDVLDQTQTQYDADDKKIYTTQWYGQAFTPSLPVLTRVKLYIGKCGSPTTDFVVSIRATPAGSDLAVVSKAAGALSASMTWVEFDFPDFSVTPETIYYLTMRTSGGCPSDSYVCGYGMNDPYSRGLMGYSDTSGTSWIGYSAYDFCFKTYGASSITPDYTLTINIVGSGTVTKNPDMTSYPDGTLVTLTAIEDPFWTFSEWSGDVTGSANPETILMDSDKTVTATFTAKGPEDDDWDYWTNPPHMFSIPTGNVGIGTTTPAEHLTLGPGYNFVSEMAPPAGVNATAIDGGGTLPAGTYYFQIVACNEVGTSVPSHEASCTVDGIVTTKISLTWSAVGGATEYRIYKGSTPDGEDRYFISNTNAYEYVSDVTATLGTPPDTTTAYVNKIGAQNSWFLGDGVGIGTSQPDVKLDVHVSQGAAATIGSPSCHATGNHSIAMGFSTTASGPRSIAMGSRSIASGNSSTAMGSLAIASGDSGATAMGQLTSASGDNGATAMGSGSRARGDWGTTAIGCSMTVDGVSSVGIGLSCVPEYVTADNVMVVMGGNVGIGTTDPQRTLHINDVLRLEPLSDFPTSGSDGDICVKGIPGDYHMYCYLNGNWRQLD